LGGDGGSSFDSAVGRVEAFGEPDDWRYQRAGSIVFAIPGPRRREIHSRPQLPRPSALPSVGFNLPQRWVSAWVPIAICAAFYMMPQFRTKKTSIPGNPTHL
jgi:hypothetical protein